MGRRKKFPLLENIEITGIGAEGKAITKYNDIIVFVSFAVPGDIVDIQINRKKKNFMEGYVTKFHKFSKNRIEPQCEHFGICGGCKWQMLPYNKQLDYKQNQIKDSLERLGKIKIPAIDKILPSEETYYYRNKLEYTFSNKRWLTKNEINSDNDKTDMDALGFHVPKKFDKILDIKNCYLQKEPSNSIRLAIKKFAVENKYSFYDIKNHSGYLRNVIIRTSTTGDLMVIISFAKKDDEKQSALLDFLNKKFPEISSLMYVINPKKNETLEGLEVICYSGKEYIIETMGNLQFKISAKSFYQTNSKQAYNLYKVVEQLAEIKQKDIVYDLYTGTGTIANFIANKCLKVIGIEYVEDAVTNAVENSNLNKITNTIFFAGDIKNILDETLTTKYGNPDVLITDPPRVGMHKDVVAAILRLKPGKIIYVSCNPATQARDIAMLDEKYIVTKVQPVDMFPHTHHVENVVKLMLRK